MSTLGSLGLLGCAAKSQHAADGGGAGDQSSGGGQSGTGGRAGAGGGQAGAPAGAGGSIGPAGSAGNGGASGGIGGTAPGGTTGAGGTSGSAGSTGAGGVTGQAGGGGATGGTGLSVSATAATFPDTLVESVSASRTFTVRNDGSATTVAAALQGPNAAEFLITSNGCAATLQPGASCDVAVAFAPKVRSGARSATLAVSSTSSPAAAVPLSGTALPSLTLLAGTMGGSGYADGTGAGARFYFPVGVATDGTGALFVADSYTLTIRRIDAATGAVTTLAGAAFQEGTADGVGPAARFTDLKGITSDGAGSLYVIDAHGIRKVVVATAAVTTLTDDTGVPFQIDGPTAITSDGAGYLYVADADSTSSFSDSTIRRISVATGTLTTIADRMGLIIHFDSIKDLVSDRAGNLYVTDVYVIEKIALATGTVTPIAGTLTDFAPSRDGTGADARFNALSGITIDSNGNLFVAEGDNGDGTIRKIVIATGTVTTIAGTFGQSGSADGTGAAASFAYPKGMAIDAAGNLFVADVYNNTVRKVVVATGAVTTLAGMAGDMSSADGTGAAARIALPGGVASDGAGNLYVSDRNLYTVRKIVIATGVVTTFAGSGHDGAADGTGAAASFSQPSDLVFDGAGNLFLADTGNSTVRKLVIATRAVTTLAGAAAGFNGPWGIATDGAGNLFVADSQNHTIRKVVIATRTVTTLAGVAGEMGSKDGTGAAARFYWPCGIAADGAGNLYVADTGNGTIRRIVVATGAVTTIAGAAGAMPMMVDGTGTAARFAGPNCITADGAGGLYVCDDTTIRKIDIASAAVSTVIGMAGRRGVLLGQLPASLNGPYDVAILPTGELAIVDTLENSILIAHP